MRYFFLSLLLELLLSSFQPAAFAENIILVVNTEPSSKEMAKDFESFNQYLYSYLKLQFPNQKPYFLNVVTNDQFLSELQSIIKETTVVDALVISSHGQGGILQEIKHSKNKTKFQIKPSAYAKISNQLDNGVDIVLGHVHPVINDMFTKQLKHVFEPLFLHWGENPKIIFTGCELLGHATEKDRFELMVQIAKNFKLKSGSLYMNRTSGSFAYYRYFKQPIAVENTFTTKLQRIGMYILSPLSLPIATAKDFIQHNKGYSLLVRQEASVPFVMYIDRYFHALQSFWPYGKPVYAGLGTSYEATDASQQMSWPVK